MTASVTLLPREICGPRFFLFGGGGCRTTGNPVGAWSWLSGLLLLLGAFLLRRHRLMFAMAKRAKKMLPFFILLLAMFAVGCGEDTNNQPDREPPLPIGTPCPGTDDMVAIPSIRGLLPFCIDRYEASTREGEIGERFQIMGGDGSTTAVAESRRFVKPLKGISWFQATQMCKNAGKRLCTADEWQTACRGDDDVTYPYGDTYIKTTCNGFEAFRGDTVEAGGMISGVMREDGFFDAMGCVTQHGVYDMSGNVWEWNSTGYFDDSRRGLAGGSFRSNSVGMRCVTDDNHAEPGNDSDSFGFRCCKDFP